jgi:hypothetical protein
MRVMRYCDPAARCYRWYISCSPLGGASHAEMEAYQTNNPYVEVERHDAYILCITAATERIRG